MTRASPRAPPNSAANRPFRRARASPPRTCARRLSRRASTGVSKRGLQRLRSLPLERAALRARVPNARHTLEDDEDRRVLEHCVAVHRACLDVGERAGAVLDRLLAAFAPLDLAFDDELDAVRKVAVIGCHVADRT